MKKVKETYIYWHDCHAILPKTHRYTFGQKIDKMFVDCIELIVTANFLTPQEKLPYVRLAVRKLDTIKVFFMILWEIKSMDEKKYIALSVKVDEVGRMLGGWQGQLLKQNSPIQKK